MKDNDHHILEKNYTKILKESNDRKTINLKIDNSSPELLRKFIGNIFLIMYLDNGVITSKKVSTPEILTHKIKTLTKEYGLI